MAENFILGFTLTIFSFNQPIPDALTTITEFMNQMELVLSQNGNNMLFLRFDY